MAKITLVTAAAGAGLLLWDLKNEFYKRKFPQFLRARERNMEKPELRKVINDPIHGTIPLHPLAVKIIDTPEFQRLRHIKQLGAMQYVYPSATYNRFEHSIGVYHLAGELLKQLKEQKPELKIEDVDILCVQLAGLTHDLGHGPFSHLFDGRVVPELKKRAEKTKSEKGSAEQVDWQHEKGSVDMLEHIYNKRPEVKKCFDDLKMTKQDLEFIKTLILKPNEVDWEAVGRGKDKKFLYEVVANKRNGIDVDKWDYLARDNYHLGIKYGFDYTRLLHNLRVLESEGELQICVRDKEAGAINSMFHARFDLHEKACQHRVVYVAELMIAEALIKAADHLRFGGKSMLECLDDMDAYIRLHDGVFHQILDSTHPDLEESRKLLENLQSRKLWKFVGEIEVGEDDDISKVEDEIRQAIGRAPVKISKYTRSLGQKGKDPLKELRYYSKEDPCSAVPLPDHVGQITWPTKFKQTWLRVFYTNVDEKYLDKKVKNVRALFKEFKDSRLSQENKQNADA